jgi:stearoyl-CoA desaturase (delta-9 desaturase)
VRAVPFALMHLACIAVIWVGISWTAVIVAAALYAVRMFAITAFYHRYFSHRTFQASRPVQFVFAVIGASSVQRGPLWWAPTIATTTVTPTSRWTHSPVRAASGAATWAGS